MVQVKSGKVSSRDIRDSWERSNVKRRDGHLYHPRITQPADDHGSGFGGFLLLPRLAAELSTSTNFTVEELLHGAQVQMPPSSVTFKQAQKAEQQPGASRRHWVSTIESHGRGHMKIDKLVEQRFHDLEQKAIEILKNKSFDFRSLEGKNYYTVDTPKFEGWATNALNLLQRVFGEDSVHYQHFKKQHEDFRGWQVLL